MEPPDGRSVGIDEANFSPSLAGDCVVVALWLPQGADVAGIDDSKHLTERQRLDAFARLQAEAIYSVQCATPADIGRFGIYRARDMAALTALWDLDQKLIGEQVQRQVLVPTGIGAVRSDTSLRRALEWFRNEKAEEDREVDLYIRVRAGEGDALVAAASIVAKTYVDALFDGYERMWPGYNLGSNHGSMDAGHRAALRESGPTPVHRRGRYAKDWWEKMLA